MHVFTDSKVALRDAVTRPTKRLSSWELANGGPPGNVSKGRWNGIMNLRLILNGDSKAENELGLRKG